MKVNISCSASVAFRQAEPGSISNSSVEKKLSDGALSQQLPFLLMLCAAPACVSSCRKLLAANSMPRSEWKISPGGGLRLAKAFLRASPDRSASRWSPSDQPTTLRENRSRMTTRKMKPPITGRYVESATQTLSGASAVKSRARRLGATGSRWEESVVFLQRRRWRALRPWSARERATRFRLVLVPL